MVSTLISKNKKRKLNSTIKKYCYLIIEFRFLRNFIKSENSQNNLKAYSYILFKQAYTMLKYKLIKKVKLLRLICFMLQYHQSSRLFIRKLNKLIYRGYLTHKFNHKKSIHIKLFI